MLQVVLVPDVLFLIFLAINARRSYDILTRNPSMTMWTYYILVWAVCLVNFLHTSLQLAGRNSQGQDGSEHTALWNLTWLLTRFVMMMLEVRRLIHNCGNNAQFRCGQRPNASGNAGLHYSVSTAWIHWKRYRDAAAHSDNFWCHFSV